MIDVSELMVDPDFVQTVKLKTLTVITINFVASSVVEGQDILAAVQPADRERLNPDGVDWSREYIAVYSSIPIDLGQFIEWKGKDFKVIQLNNFNQNGYCDVVAEETKLPLLIPVEPGDNTVTFNSIPVTYNGQFVTYTP